MIEKDLKPETVSDTMATKRHILEIPKRLRKSDVSILVDTREQKPLHFRGIQARPSKLQTGDYTMTGVEKIARIERKSLIDLVSCCGHGRERFERELERLQAFRYRCVVMECGWVEICAGEWPGKITPEQVKQSILSWQSDVPFFLAGGRLGAAEVVENWLWHIARHVHEILIQLRR